MTKKHFIMIAAILKTIQNPLERWNICDKFAHSFKNENGNFRREQFMKACEAFHPMER